METFPAVMLTGSRQAGKTTLLVNEFEGSHRYVSLDRPDVRERALADPVAFFAENPPPIILDEIQHAPGLLPYIKDQIDRDRTPGRWLITGSQKFSLMKGVSETLAGRIAVLELAPLSVSEVARQPAPASVELLLSKVFGGTGAGTTRGVSLDDWLLRGGYPEPRLNPRVDRRLWFSSYVQTYLERDVRDLLQVGDLAAFSRFLRLVASRTGTLLNLTDLGREVGVTGPTARRWLSVLEASHVVHLLPPYHRNFGKRIRKSPKIYLLDPGLATYLMGLHSAEAVLHGPSLGALAETAVISEWLKAVSQAGEDVDLFFWRSSDGIEVDLVLEHQGSLHGLEVKATATPTPHHADALARWLKLAGGQASGAVACRVERPTSLRPGIRAVPWHLAW
jgi:predicted AAA+ superfamily ATPase